MAERKVNAGVALVLVNKLDQVLMGKRKGSHGAGTWSFPGGWMRFGEDFYAAAKRELKEETDINLDLPPDHLYTGTTIFQEADIQSVTVLLTSRHFRGVAKVMEPDKIEGEWTWFHFDDLPDPLFKPLTQFDLHRLLIDLIV